MKEHNMKKTFLILAVPVLLFLFLSCSSQEATGSFPYGNYQYRSYNFLGDLVGEGTIYINRSDSNMVTGNWSIRKVIDCRNCGLQFGSGYLEGYIENDKMIVNLNPNEWEIDTKLIGMLADEEFSGDWRWTDEHGFGFSGTFIAVK
jgi:hypothetical protein